MKAKGNNLPVWKIANSWREIFARIFEDVETQFNVSPKWLVNPATNRRLKLDMLYPDIGVAIRLEGLQGKQRRRRPSLEEEAQQRARADARVRISEEHNIALILVDVATGKPGTVFQQIDAALSRAGQRVENDELLRKIKSARTTAATLSYKIKDIRGLKLYADLWEDRRYRLTEPAQAVTPISPIISYVAGMEVEHTIFGPGVVVSSTPSNGDTLVTVDFVTAGQKTLAASLVGDKLLPR